MAESHLSTYLFLKQTTSRCLKIPQKLLVGVITLPMTHYDSVPGQASGLSQSPAEINMMGGLKSAASLSHFTSTLVRLHNVQRRSGSFRPDGLATTGVWTGAPLHPHLGAPPNDNQLELRWAPSLSAGNSPPSHCWLRKSHTFQKKSSSLKKVPPNNNNQAH